MATSMVIRQVDPFQLGMEDCAQFFLVNDKGNNLAVFLTVVGGASTYALLSNLIATTSQQISHTLS